MIAPIEIGRIKSRYDKMNISEFDIMTPRRRVEGLTLYLAERVHRSFRAPPRPGIAGHEFADILTGRRGKRANVN